MLSSNSNTRLRGCSFWSGPLLKLTVYKTIRDWHVLDNDRDILFLSNNTQHPTHCQSHCYHYFHVVNGLI